MFLYSLVRRAPVMAAIAVILACHAVNAQTDALPYNPVDAQYSMSLDRIIMISTNPNQLHIYDPASQTERTVGLPKPPLALSVSPDGFYAAVGHDALISYIDLTAGIIRTQFTTTFTVTSLVLSPSWIYLVQGVVESIYLPTGSITPGNYYGYQTTGKFDAANNALYALNYSQMLRIDISTGPMTTISYSGFYNSCAPLWVSQDGSRLYSGCSTALQASNNSSLDMDYITTLPGSGNIAALADSAALQMVAAVRSYCCTVTDATVQLYSSPYLQPIGQFTLSNFTSNGKTYAPHGKWLFFNAASSALYAIAQADSSAGLTNSYAVQTFSMAPPVPCGATIGTQTAESGPAGALGSAAIISTPECAYQASSDAAWLQIVSGGYGSGNGTLTYMARPNLAKTARTGTISMGGQTLVITQDAAPATASALTPLSYNPAGAAYDAAVDKLILTAAAPNELHIYDPISQADQVIALPAPPLSLSLSPDGSHAAVGHDGWISYVNLAAPALPQVFTVNARADSVVLAGNGYVYFDSAGYLYTLQLAGGGVTASYYFSGPAQLAPDGHSIYSGAYYKYDITQGDPSPINLVNRADDCGNFWFSQDGTFLLTACGAAYTVSNVESQDLVYYGTLPNTGNLVWATESSLVRSIAAIPNTGYPIYASDAQVQIFGDEYLGYAGSLPLPQFQVGASTFTGHGKYVFWNAAASHLYVVEQADSSAALLSSYAVDVISPYTPVPGCSYSLGSSSASEPQDAGFDSVSVTTGVNCSWTASSNASWVTITSGTVGFGSAFLNFEFAANTGAARSAVLTIGGQKFTVNQAGAPCTYTISPPAVYLDQKSQSSSVTVTTNGPACAWTVTPGGGFITITGGASGSGNGPVTFIVTANGTGYLRTGSLAIGGQTVNVTQRETATVFTDVNPPDYFFDFTNVIYQAGITSGCLATPFEYCPNDTITRGQMAVFLVMGVEGTNTFTYTTIPYFTDVPPSSQFFKFIQKLRDLGITTGCSATQFCPNDPVTRAQMAAFIIRSRYQTTPYTYPSAPYFTDVPPSNIFFPFIQKMAQAGITSGCAPNLYCPDATLTRGQMSVFIVTGLLNELMLPGTPLIASASPNSAARGQAVTVTLTGTNTHFVQGTTQVTAAPGISVSNLQVASSTSLTVQLSVGAGFVPNPTSLVATTGTEEAVLPNGFTVQ